MKDVLGDKSLTIMGYYDELNFVAIEIYDLLGL